MTDPIKTPAEALEATARDEFDELAYRFWAIHPKEVTEPIGMPEDYPGGKRAWMYANEMRALSARIAEPVATVKPLVWPDFREGGTCGRPPHVQYFVTQDHAGNFWSHFDDQKFGTLAEAQANCEAHWQRNMVTLQPAAQPAPVATVKPQDGPGRIWLDRGFQPYRIWTIEIPGLQEYIRADLAQPAAQAQAEARDFEYDNNLTRYICCNGADCGCRGATAGDYAAYQLRALSAQAQCCMCGKLGLSTDEDGGPECQLWDGRWTCGRDCYDAAVAVREGTSPSPVYIAQVQAEAVAGAMRAAYEGLFKHANGTTVLGGQSYRSLTLEVAAELLISITPKEAFEELDKVHNLAVAEEQEACAKVADQRAEARLLEYQLAPANSEAREFALHRAREAKDIAAAIRKRGTK